MKRQQTRLILEALEDRCTPSASGLPWPDAQHLTLSFAPDGAELLGHSSQLFSLLDEFACRDEWQTEILRAFQSWAIWGNVNIGLVADGGQPFGSAGAPQGDDRFGDVRIGTYELSSEVIAVASGFDFLAGTWSGDVKLNSSWNWSRAELFSVMLHEAGHVFGFEHDDDPASAMYEVFHALSGLSSHDVAHFQELYGVRAADSFDATRANGDMLTASSLNTGSAEGDLTTLEDVDWYRFSPAANSNEVTVRLQASGLSLLTARITVYDANGNVLGCDVADSPLDNDLQVHFSRHRGMAPYYVKVEKAAADVFGIGSYRLQIDSDCVDNGNAVNNGSADNGNAGTNGGPPDHNDSIWGATSLQRKISSVDPRFDYAVAVNLSSGGDVDFFRFQAPSKKEGENFVLTGLAWNTQAGGTAPLLTFFDAKGNPLAADLLTNEDGTFAIQFKDALPTAHFFVAVQAQGAEGGDYFLALDFGSRAVDLVPLVEQVTFTSQQDLGTLHVGQSQLFHFVIDAASSSGTQPWSLSVLDQAGNVVEQFSVTPGQAFSATFYLTQGDYRFLLTPAAPSALLTLSLRAIGLTDPIGPEAADATLAPIGTSASANLSAWWELGFLGLIQKPTPGPVTDGAGAGSGGAIGPGPGAGGGTESSAGSGGTVARAGMAAALGTTSDPAQASVTSAARALASLLTGQTVNSPLVAQSATTGPPTTALFIGSRAAPQPAPAPLPRTDATQNGGIEIEPEDPAGRNDGEASAGSSEVPPAVGENASTLPSESTAAVPMSSVNLPDVLVGGGNFDPLATVAATNDALPDSAARRQHIEIVLISVLAFTAIYGLHYFDRSEDR